MPRVGTRGVDANRNPAVGKEPANDQASPPPNPFQIRFEELLRGGALVSEARSQALREHRLDELHREHVATGRKSWATRLDRYGPSGRP